MNNHQWPHARNQRHLPSPRRWRQSRRLGATRRSDMSLSCEDQFIQKTALTFAISTMKTILSTILPACAAFFTLLTASLAAPGDLDTGFNPNVDGPGQVSSMAVQPDGKIVIEGYFSTVGGVARTNIARLNANRTR